MKREIKFRFWLGHTKNMTYEHSLIDISHTSWDFTEDIIPLQFTGLKDRNGKEIYEGDIVKINGRKRIGSYITQIVWRKCGFTIEKNETYFVDDSVLVLSKHIEVIGNIYENPEL